MPKQRFAVIKNAKGQAPLDEAELELYPGVPYERYTPAMRFATYERAKQIYFTATGHLMPGMT